MRRLDNTLDRHCLRSRLNIVQTCPVVPTRSGIELQPNVAVFFAERPSGREPDIGPSGRIRAELEGDARVESRGGGYFSDDVPAFGEDSGADQWLLWRVTCWGICKVASWGAGCERQKRGERDDVF